MTVKRPLGVVGAIEAIRIYLMPLSVIRINKSHLGPFSSMLDIGFIWVDLSK